MRALCSRLDRDRKELARKILRKDPRMPARARDIKIGTVLRWLWIDSWHWFFAMELNSGRD
jgi:hypothetical protein